jgi:hypothetical protein
LPDEPQFAIRNRGWGRLVLAPTERRR